MLSALRGPRTVSVGKQQPAQVTTAIERVTATHSIGTATIIAERMSPEQFAEMNQHVRAELAAKDAAGELHSIELKGAGGDAILGLERIVHERLGATNDRRLGDHVDRRHVAPEAQALAVRLNALAREGKLSTARPLVISHLGYDARTPRSGDDRTLEQLYSLQLNLREARGSVRVLHTTSFAPRDHEGVFVRSTGLDWVVP